MMAQLFTRSLTLPVLTPAQRDTLKLIAFLAMTADHLNTLFSLHHGGLMMAGRMAFPLFALVWGMNQARYPVMRQSSLNRLWLGAILAQPAYALMLMQAGSGWYQLNILFTFAVAGQGMRWWHLGNGWAKAGAGVLVLAYLPFSLTSYFLPGLVLLWLCAGLFRQSKPVSWVHVMVTACVVLLLNLHAGVLYALSGLILSLGMVVAVQTIPGTTRYLPNGVFLYGYPAHLMALGVIYGVYTTPVGVGG